MIKFILIIGILFSLTTVVMAKSPYTPDNQLTLPPNPLEVIDTTTLKREFKETAIQMRELGDKLCSARDRRSTQYAENYYEFIKVRTRFSKIWHELTMRRGKEIQ